MRKKIDKIISDSKSILRKPSVDLIDSTNPFEEKDEELVGTEYINQEIIILKQRQEELDEKGIIIEKQLRSIMKKTNDEEQGNKISEKEKKLEDKLLKEWFLLVNERDVLLHQQQELEIL